MALQLWLPLNGNLENKGISSMSKTSGTPTYIDSRMGKGYSLNSQTVLSVPGLKNAKKFTVMFWAKVDTCVADWADLLYLSTQKADGTSSSTFRFEATISSRACSWHNNTGYAISGGTQIMITTKGEWHHVCVAYDGAKVYSYTDGVLLSTQTGNGGHLLGTVGIGESNTGVINDVRIYDDCLDNTTIQDIAQGLIAHYPLHPLWGANLEKSTNMGTNGFSAVFGGYYKATLSATQWLGVNACRIDLAVKDSTSTSKYKVLCHKAVTFNSILKPNTVYTISFDTDKKKWYNASVEATNGTHDLGAPAQAADAVITDCGGYYHYAYQFTTYSADNEAWTYSDQWIYLTMPEFIDDYVLIANLKIEEGDGDTPWIPHVGDAGYNSDCYTIKREWDTSGFDYNLNLGGSTLPRPNGSSCIGKTSYTFDGSTSVMYRTGVTIPSIWTVSLWFRPRLLTDTTQYLISLNSGNSGSAGQQIALYVNTTQIVIHAGGTYSTITKTLENGVWYHLVLTCDGSQQKAYLNGVLIGSAEVGTVTGTNLTLGARSNNANGAGSAAAYFFNGELTDVRIYSQALKDSSIQRLYSTRASIGENSWISSGFQEYNTIEKNCTIAAYTGNDLSTVTSYKNAGGIYQYRIVNDSGATFGTGLSVANNSFTNGHIYKLSFRIKLISGVLKLVGGHNSSYTILGKYVDGKLSSTAYSGGGPTEEQLYADNQEHMVEVYFQFKQASDNQKLYVQLNRNAATACTADIYDIRAWLVDSNTYNAQIKQNGVWALREINENATNLLGEEGTATAGIFIEN